MTFIERDIVVQEYGQVLLNHLPYPKGDHVTARLFIARESPPEAREAAFSEFLLLSRQSTFKSVAP